MAAFDSPLLPLVELQPIADGRYAWVALSVAIAPDQGDRAQALHALFDPPDLLAAIAPLDCVLLLASASVLTPALLKLMPPNRVVLAVSGAVLAEPGAATRLLSLQEQGYRVLLDGPAPSGIPVPAVLRAKSLDCSGPARPSGPLSPLFGPHLARRVGSAARFGECEHAGFKWFSGTYPLHPAPLREADDGTSRKRLLSLLALLARDAESRELELLLKQDPALSYQLFKLVNSAAFALGTPIASFAQAINLLGRRQLQRWLQLLLYARQRDDGLPNPLLPLAALRGAQMEMLCKLQGGAHEAQDLAFMAGVFSLLDVLLCLPMAELVGALSLAPDTADALLERGGPLGKLLALVETGSPRAEALQQAGIDRAGWWQSQLHGYHWAIQVSRNL